ncbi:hypothetical protein, partial [Methanosarcina sp. 2.H.T.1A.8]|uniref:hypothetical protein n=1 Tax=Methanosarcina sp. 2.H.T.1A.8 TaxID=1483598 RepID=UPI001F25F43E
QSRSSAASDVYKRQGLGGTERKKLKDSFPGFFLFSAYFPLALKPPAQEQNFISCREKVVSINILFFIKFWGI